MDLLDLETTKRIFKPIPRTCFTSGRGLGLVASPIERPLIRQCFGNAAILYDLCKGLVGGLHSTKAAFLLPTQQPQVRIPSQPRFFIFTALLVNSIEIDPIKCYAMDFTNAVGGDVQS